MKRFGLLTTAVLAAGDRMDKLEADFDRYATTPKSSEAALSWPVDLERGSVPNEPFAPSWAFYSQWPAEPHTRRWSRPRVEFGKVKARRPDPRESPASIARQ